jgi:hypothetical protein
MFSIDLTPLFYSISAQRMGSVSTKMKFFQGRTDGLRFIVNESAINSILIANTRKKIIIIYFYFNERAVLYLNFSGQIKL